MTDRLKAYYALTKPGIIRGNLMAAAAGFLFASQGRIDAGLLMAVLASISLVIASACVFNNYTDRNIDKKMARTKQRALAKGLISHRNALIFAVVMGVAGFLILAKFTNILTFCAGAIGFIDYVVVYGITKRTSTLGTLVGSISGAMPLVAGYLAVSNSLSITVLILFLLMVFWQMAHFFAIALYRYDDYKAARLPVLPVKKNTLVAKRQIMVYIAAFNTVVLLSNRFGYTSMIFTVVMGLMGAVWFFLGLKDFKTSNNKSWGKTMFLFSLLVVTLLSFMLSTDAIFSHYLYTGNMLIIFHIVSATVSLVLASYLLIKPSRTIYRATNGLAVGVLGSGTYLVWSRHASLLPACMAGLSYLSFVSAALFITRLRLQKLATIKLASKD